MAAGKSIRWIVTASMILIGLFGWGFMAGSYEGATATKLSELPAGTGDPFSRPTPRRIGAAGIVVFVVNAFEQLPNIHTVIYWHLTNRIWLPVLIILLEIGAFFAGFKLRSLDEQLYGSKR